MIYNQLGIIPIIVDIRQRVVSFWCKLSNGQDTNKLSSNIYSVVYAMYENKHLKSCWISNIRSILCSLRFSGIWYSQSFCNSKWSMNAVKQKLKDTYIQKWYSLLEVSSRSNKLLFSILSHNLGRSSGHHGWISNTTFSPCPVFSCPS